MSGRVFTLTTMSNELLPFPLEVAEDVHETPLPSWEELQLLRQEIDPLGIRKLEALSGAERRQLLHEIIARETPGKAI